VRPQVFNAMDRMGLIDLLGRENIFDNIYDALEYSRKILAEQK
jgi:hypothetical protein